MVRLQIAAGIRRSALVRCPSGVFFILVLCLAACSTAIEPHATLDPRLRIGVPEGNADGTELGVRQLARNMTAEALTQISTEGRALPRLAESWSWEGENRLRIKLRDGVTLHDGRRFDAQMAAEQLAVAIAAGANRESYPGLGDVRSAIPDGTLDFTLNLAKASPSYRWT